MLKVEKSETVWAAATSSIKQIYSYENAFKQRPISLGTYARKMFESSRLTSISVLDADSFHFSVYHFSFHGVIDCNVNTKQILRCHIFIELFRVSNDWNILLQRFCSGLASQALDSTCSTKIQSYVKCEHNRTELYEGIIISVQYL